MQHIHRYGDDPKSDLEFRARDLADSQDEGGFAQGWRDQDEGADDHAAQPDIVELGGIDVDKGTSEAIGDVDAKLDGSGQEEDLSDATRHVSPRFFFVFFFSLSLKMGEMG